LTSISSAPPPGPANRARPRRVGAAGAPSPGTSSRLPSRPAGPRNAPPSHSTIACQRPPGLLASPSPAPCNPPTLQKTGQGVLNRFRNPRRGLTAQQSFRA
jgi:hypothetical protein